jgi:orotate phosphoribosyltransferase
MENKAFKVSLAKNPKISMMVIQGHFSTSYSHNNHYLDVTRLKSDALVASDVARELSIPYLSSALVDTIVCVDKTEVIGAYLARELIQGGRSMMSYDDDINIVTPMISVSGKMLFPDSMIDCIADRNIILLSAWVLSGRTVNVAQECIEYYGGKLTGVSTLFLALPPKVEREVHTLFTSDDIPDFKTFYPVSNCEMCRAGQKLDAIVTTEGYTKIEQ